jgi:KaiC/GvpD/RAD55 family RecA-like ATPase
VERVNTYVKGLDGALEGGIPAGSVVLVCGQPGTMKSSLSYSILHGNAKAGVPGIYASLEQSARSLREHMEGLGMPYAGLEMKLGIQDLGMLRKKLKVLSKEAWYQAFQKTFGTLCREWGAKLIVIDQLQVFAMMAKFKEPREEMFHFMEWLRDEEMTAFLISEMKPGADVFAEHGVDFLADGILHLDLKRQGSVVNLYLGIAKMRRTSHKRTYFPLICERGGMEMVTD